jgi:demethylmacrocin O-methyltransferase
MLIFWFCSFFCFLSADPLSEYRFLDQLALGTYTDKGSNAHNYTEIYAEYFAPVRTLPLKFLEIGVGGGSSAQVWDTYFPNAEIHFIDVEPTVLNQKKPERIQYHVVDQADAPGLKAFVNKVGGDFDVILDDGGHLMHQQIISFQTLFPHVRSGGLYIIEDLHTSYWNEYGGNGTRDKPKAGPGTALEFLKQLVEDLNYTSGITGYGDWKRTTPEVWSQMSDIQKSIHSIHFYRSLCIIKKL